jgi:hypothetical protein
MKWTNFTDYCFSSSYDHFFTIKKPEYRNDIIEWYIKHNDEIIAEGKTTKMTVAKAACKDVYTRLKSENKGMAYK